MNPEQAERELAQVYAEIQRRVALSRPIDIERLRLEMDDITASIKIGGPIPQDLQLLWERNEAWKVVLDEGQRRWVDLWNSFDTSVYNGSGRQRGKSLFALCIIDMACRAHPGTRTRWTGLTIDTARAIVGQAGEDFWRTCPEHLKPVKKGDDYVYPNGSIIIVMGTDAQTFRRGRGFGRISVDVRDECGFYHQQDFLKIDSALSPGLSVPGPNGKIGRVLYSSTPSESPAHDSNRFVRAHQARGAFICETFLENPRIDPESVIKAEVDKSIGLSREAVLASTAFRREFLGELLLEETDAAVPRWEQMRGPDQAKHNLIQILPRPAYFDAYVSLDLGGHLDPHAVLFSYFNPEDGTLYFEDELELPSSKYVVSELVGAIKEKEKELYGASRWDGTLAGAEFWQKEFGKLPEYLRTAISKSAPHQPFMRCVAEGSLVTMEDGSLKPIELVRAGDFVLTRKGSKRVTWAGLTGENRETLTLKTPIGELTTTPDHQFATPEGGWAELRSFQTGDSVVSCTTTNTSTHPPSPTLLSGEVSNGDETSTRITQRGLTTTIAKRRSETGSIEHYGFIERFGGRITESFRKDMSFTTKTGIHSTTTSPISNAFPKETTSWSISRMMRSFANLFSKLAQRLFRSHVNRGELNKVGSVFGAPGSQLSQSAKAVAALYSQSPREDQRDSAVQLADRSSEERVGSIASSRSAFDADQNSNPLAQTEFRIVETAVLSVEKGPSSRVYDLTVEDAHEFFVNGILVHNCGDNDNLVLNTLNVEHGLAVIPTKKSDKILHVDMLNSLIGQGRIKVHPKCVRLITQLSSTTWNKARTTWNRTGTDHGDLIDVAVYTVRNVMWKRDPRPAPYVDPFLMKPPKNADLKQQLSKLFLVKR